MRLLVFFYGLHHRKSHLRHWVRWDLLWKSHHQRKSGPSREETPLYLHCHKHVRGRRYSRSLTWRRLHGFPKIDLEILFLDEPP